MSDQVKKTSPLDAIYGLFGAGMGWGLSQYCGASIWIPIGGAIALFVLFTKTSFRPKQFAGAIAVTGGHVLCFAAAAAATGLWFAVILDIAIMLLGIVFLWIKPGLGSAIFLGLFQIIALVMNIIQLVHFNFGDVQSRALTSHITLRLLAIVCLVIGYIKMRRERSLPPPLISTHQPE